MTNSPEEFEYGDEVHCILNGDVWGVVVGWDAHKIVYRVQLSPSLNIVPMHGCILRKEDGGEVDPGSRDGLPIGEVIPVDFKQRKRKEVA
jgi:hypothetical protein